MGVTTSHHISNYYDFFRDKEIVFTKANVKALRMDPRQIYLKCNGGQWPCIINSSSLQQAKVFIGAASGVLSLLKNDRNMPVSIRYCFFDNNNNPVQFFVNCTVYEVKPYANSKELVILTLNFTQRPPDDLILRIGEFLEVNNNFLTRKEERISLNENSLRQLAIPKEESYIFISGVPRKCIMKDLSFGGARVMLVGIPKFLLEKMVELKLYFTDTLESVAIPGVVKGANFLEGRQDICVINVEFIADSVPMTYKFHINSYITSYQKHMIEKQLINKTKQIQRERAMQAAAGLANGAGGVAGGGNVYGAYSAGAVAGAGGNGVSVSGNAGAVGGSSVAGSGNGAYGGTGVSGTVGGAGSNGAAGGVNRGGSSVNSGNPGVAVSNNSGTVAGNGSGNNNISNN